MRIRKPLKLASLVLTCLLADTAAFADVLPGSVMPEQVAKALKPKPSMVPTNFGPAPVVQPASKAPQVSPEQQKITFKLNGITLVGNHVYSTADLKPIYQDKIGKTISVADLFTIVQNITNYYRNNGYIITFATLPPQKSKNGVVTIQVIEGYLNNVAVTGEPHGVKCLVEGFGYRIRKCPPLNIATVESNMLLVNEVPNTSVKAVLSPSKEGLGGADLNLVTVSKPISAYFSEDNYGTRYIGPQQMTGNVTLYSLINSGDSTALTFTKTTKGGELTFADLDYNAALGDGGIRYTLGITHVHTHPLFVLQPTETDGLNNNFYANIVYPYLRTRSQSINFTAGFNWLESASNTILGLLYDDHIRSLDLGMNYNFADRFYGANMFGFNLRKGLPLWGYSQDTNQFTANTSRPGGYATYTKISSQISRLQSIKGNFSLLAIARGTWAFVPLLSSEQFTFGGNPMGRGYDPAEIIGDRGLAGSLELRYDLFLNRIVNSMQFYVFYDIGSMWNILVNFTSPAKVSASSTGAGIRFTMSKYISGNLMWTQPLTKTVAAEALIGRGWLPRTYFSIVANFD